MTIITEDTKVAQGIFDELEKINKFKFQYGWTAAPKGLKIDLDSEEYYWFKQKFGVK
jgi:hypothetical protein